MKRYLQCFAYRQDGVWQAVCVDLDISVVGASLSEVKRELKLAVHDYIESVLNEDEATRKRLLNRRTPLRVRVALYADELWAKLTFGHDGHAVRFPVASAA